MNQHRLLIVLVGFVAVVLGSQPLSAADKNTTRRPSLVLDPLPATSTAAVSKLDARRNMIVSAIERVRDAVVNIHSERTVPGSGNDLFSVTSAPNRVNGMGTGIIIDPRGYIVTNQHVVEDVNIIRVRLADGTSTNATVVARSRSVDLALLRIDIGRSLPTMPLGTAADLMVGETVIAIGNAFGYEHTVSRGIVSSVKRDVSLNTDMFYRSLIQTDASINPGNSGGPLLNVHGELVGVNVAIRAGAQGIGFAIPVDHMIDEVSEMLRAQRTDGIGDGLTVKNVISTTPDGAVRTVEVQRVQPGSAAAEAGLLPGDILKKIDSVDVCCTLDVDRAFLGQRPGENIAVTYQRGGKEHVAKLTLNRSASSSSLTSDLVWRKLGLQFVSVSKQDLGSATSSFNGGLQIVKIQPNGVAARAGIQVGDILLGLHRWETLSADNVAFVLQHPELQSIGPITFYIIRGGQLRRGVIERVE